MIAVFAALRLEVQRFLRRVDVRDRARLGGFPVTLGEYEGRPLLVCHTGIGSRAAEAAATVLGRYRPEIVLSVGLAGALSPECTVGDLVFCEQVYRAEPESEAGRAAGPMLSDLLLLETARRAASGRGLSTRTGSSLTTSCLVAEPRQKTLLRQATAGGSRPRRLQEQQVGEHRLGSPAGLALRLRPVHLLAEDQISHGALRRQGPRQPHREDGLRSVLPQHRGGCFARPRAYARVADQEGPTFVLAQRHREAAQAGAVPHVHTTQEALDLQPQAREYSDHRPTGCPSLASSSAAAVLGRRKPRTCRPGSVVLAASSRKALGLCIASRMADPS